jgi:hypothetical protein
MPSQDAEESAFVAGNRPIFFGATSGWGLRGIKSRPEKPERRR